MIRAIDNRPLDLTDDEFEYYLQIMKEFNYVSNVFQDTFEVDENDQSAAYGHITLVKPPLNRNLPMGVVFFLFNIMLNQRIRKFEEMMSKIEELNGSK